MSHCPKCRHANPPDAKFCLECGQRLARACAACGTELPSGAKFCKECGQAVATGDSTVGPPAGSPKSYTPRHLAEKILTSKSALEGERKQVTVLFADLKGSMELLADRDPEEARKLLDPVLERMMEAVHRYEGTVNQVMGDGIMALFGAPLAHEDHAVRACYAALRMQDQVARYAEEARRVHGVNVQIRVGLNSGEVVVRAIGSDLHMDYTAVGQTTHLAARMEQFASPGSILLTGATLELVEGYVAVTSLGPVPVKGLADAVEVYQVTGAGPARTRLQASARRGLTRFVGRDAELEQLRRAQQLAGTGHGQVAAIVGEAGVGKSRLVYEFSHSHRLQGWLTLESASVSYGKATSYLPVIDLLKGYFKVQDRDDLREIREKVTGKLLTLDRALEPTLPALLALLDAPVDDPGWGALDPRERRQRTLDAVKRLLLREAHEQPLLVIFEDLHWIDSETRALLDGLVESLGSTRLLLLVNYRPEYQHAWGSKTYYGQLRLDALPAESAGELLEALLGDDPGLEPLKQLLVKRGNPFFLEETVRTLVETKALGGERGRYRLTQPVQAIQVPPTVQTMLAARIDRLPPEDKRLLQVAAVVGKDVPWALLQAIADLPDEALRSGLDRLQAAEFVYEVSLYPDLEYSFKHALTHEVAYGVLLHDRRRELHARILDALEARYPHRLAEHIDHLAYHASRAERWEKAAEYLHRAGTRAAERSAHRAAVDWLEQALAALRRLPETRDTLARGLDVRLDLYLSLFAHQEYVRMRDHLEAAEQVGVALGDRRRLGMALARLCPALRVTGDMRRSAEVGRRALAIAVEIGDQHLEGEAAFGLGQTHASLGDHRGAEELYRRNVSPLPAELTADAAGALPWFASVSRAWLANSLAQLGRFDEGLVLGAEALRVARALDNPFWLIVAHYQLGMLHQYRGRFADSVALFEQVLSIGQSRDISDFATQSAAELATAHARLGRITEAVEWARSSLSLFSGRRAEVCFLAGQREEALEAAEQELARWRQEGRRGLEGWVLYWLGEIARHRDPPDADPAERYYLEALDRATELGMRPLVAHCHLGLGQLSRRMDKRVEAREHLTTAATMYREMDMRFWLEQAEAELKEPPA